MSDLPRPPRPRRAPKLYKHPRTGYYYSVFYDPTRRPTRKWFALQTDQKRRAAKLHHEADEAWFAVTFDPWQPGAGTLAAAGHVTLTQAIDRFADHKIAAGDWRPTTRPARTNPLTGLAATLAPGIGPAHVSQDDVRRFLEAPPKKSGNVHNPARRAASTYKVYLDNIRTFFDWCVAEGHATHNPAAGLKPPKSATRRTEHLEPAEFEKLLTAVRRDHAQKLATGQLQSAPPRSILWALDVFQLAVYTGLRRGELVRLRWRDVALTAEAGPTLYVRNTGSGQTKTGKERPVPIVPPAAALLARLSAERVTEDDDAPVLTSPYALRGARPLYADAVSAAFKDYAALAGLSPALTFHSLRKTCGTWLLNRGVEMAIVQRILGHASITTTDRSYTEVWDRTVRRQVEAAFVDVVGE